MEKAMQIILVFSTISCFLFIANAANGTATFYNHYVPSACCGSKDEGVMIAAASDLFWNNKGACGKRFSVKCTGSTNGVPNPCTGKSVLVKIVDHCPGCGGTIDLSQEAFKTIANPIAGVIKIEYQEVSSGTC
ncbi:Barwin-related endoglucanase [Euphorbia peplus]|nr:Barwin-related endoglucanase [Euphorbia peplus]